MPEWKKYHVRRWKKKDSDEIFYVKHQDYDFIPLHAKPTQGSNWYWLDKVPYTEEIFTTNLGELL